MTIDSITIMFPQGLITLSGSMDGHRDPDPMVFPPVKVTEDQKAQLLAIAEDIMHENREQFLRYTGLNREETERTLPQ